MSGIGNVEVRVKPEVLISQAEEVRRLANDMKTHFQTMENTMSRTVHYWIGEAGDLHRKVYDEQKEDVDLMLRRLLEHPDELLAISQNYTQAERVNVATSAMLDADIIS